MNPLLTFATLAMVATCHALPIDMGTGLDVISGDDLNAWSKNFVIGGQPVQIGVGWKPDGTISVGGRVQTTVNGQTIPISAAVSSNYKDTKKINYEVGTKFNEKVVGVIYGDNTGTLKYLVNGWLPIQTQDGQATSIGAALEGEGVKPTALTAGVSLNGNQVIQAKIGLGDKFDPESVNVQIGSNSFSSAK